MWQDKVSRSFFALTFKINGWLRGLLATEKGLTMGILLVKKHWKRVLSAFMAVYCVLLFYVGLREMQGNVLNFNRNFEISDFLINYQGGFVRRGLCGELIHVVCRWFEADPRCVVLPLVCVCYVLLVWLFVRKFRQRGLCWWLLPMSIILSPLFLIRKDCMMLLAFLLLLGIARKMRTGWAKVALLNAVLMLMLSVHEAFAFFSLPVLALWLRRESGPGLRGWLPLLPSAVWFLVLSAFKGDAQVAQTIHDSWSPFVSAADWGEKPFGGIGAISWEAWDTFKFHIGRNFIEADGLGIRGFMVRPFVLVAVFYFLPNALWVLRGRNTRFSVRDRNNLSVVMLFQFLCLLPMFTVLSCDCGRVVRYWTLSSMAVVLWSRPADVAGMFPCWFRRFALRCAAFLRRLVRPTVPIAVFLILTLAVTPVYFSVLRALVNGVLLNFAYFAVHGGKSIILQFL